MFGPNRRTLRFADHNSNVAPIARAQSKIEKFRVSGMIAATAHIIRTISEVAPWPGSEQRAIRSVVKKVLRRRSRGRYREV
jgi:hypothetical protein